MALYLIGYVLLLLCFLMGEKSFNAFAQVLHSLPFILLEHLALAGMVFHILNGLRLLCINFGMWINQDEDMRKVVLFGTLIFSFIHSILPLIEAGRNAS